MSYLMDTHAIVWMVDDTSKLSPTVKEIIANPSNQIFICAISLWEIAIKMSIGKMSLGITFDELIKGLRTSYFDFLQVEDEYMREISNLPFLHKDPFDRLLIATATVEDMTIITIDENIHKYDVTCIW